MSDKPLFPFSVTPSDVLKWASVVFVIALYVLIIVSIVIAIVEAL